MGGQFIVLKKKKRREVELCALWRKTTDFISMNIISNISITWITPYLSTFDLNFLSLWNEKISKYFFISERKKVEVKCGKVGSYSCYRDVREGINEKKNVFFQALPKWGGGVYPCPNFLALFLEVHFWSIKESISSKMPMYWTFNCLLGCMYTVLGGN